MAAYHTGDTRKWYFFCLKIFPFPVTVRFHEEACGIVKCGGRRKIQEQNYTTCYQKISYCHLLVLNFCGIQLALWCKVGPLRKHGWCRLQMVFFLGVSWRHVTNLLIWEQFLAVLDSWIGGPHTFTVTSRNTVGVSEKGTSCRCPLRGSTKIEALQGAYGAAAAAAALLSQVQQ